MKFTVFIRHILVVFALVVPAISLASEKTDSVETVETNAFKRGFGAVKNFFRGGKRENSNVVKSEKHVKVSQEKKRSESLVKSKKTVAVKKKKEESKDYSVEELYDLSITDNLKIPKLGSQKSNIKSYQLVEAKKLVASGQQSVEMMRGGEIVIVTLDTSDLFYPNETDLKPTVGKFLNPFVKYLQVPDFYRMIIAVHSDNTGSQSYTDELTNKRAMSVMQWFSEHAECSDYVIPYGIGSAEPLVLNNSMENRAKNRRLEIFLVPGKRMISDSSKGLLKH